jgi:hypothetical protein
MDNRKNPIMELRVDKKISQKAMVSTNFKDRK